MPPILLLPLIEIFCLARKKDASHFMNLETEQVDELVDGGFIEISLPLDQDYIPWALTEKGRVFIDAILDFPEPVKEWKIPSEWRSSAN